VFETADDILRRRVPQAYAAHALSWEWKGFLPGLVVFDLGKGEVDAPRHFLPGDRLDLSISPHRRCIGSFEGGVYRPCMMRRVVSGQHDQCPQCASSWIPVQNCIFEPACDGLHDMPCGKGGSICALPHHVYAAFFGDLIKVGMTLSSRLLERGIEQGADAMAMLGTYPNRQAARRAENDISRAVKATQWVRRNTFLRLQARHLDREEYQSMLDRALSPVAGELVHPSPVQLLDNYPLTTPDLSRTGFVDLPGRHRGEVLGCKGKFLFYRLREGDVKVLDMASVPSHFITLGQENHNKS
jgi:hypothetical protein